MSSVVEAPPLPFASVDRSPPSLLPSPCILAELPEDVLLHLSSLLAPRDICNLSLTCHKLHIICRSDKLWWFHCVNALQSSGSSPPNLQAWWAQLPSYMSIFRFISAVRSLLGIWVHQNPELGNLVYVTWGFLSVVGCRIIPQELGPKGLEAGLLWAPVFEIIGAADGSLAFFLHGRENERDCCYPGCFSGAKPGCNVLLLEAEPRWHPSSNANEFHFAQPDDGDASLAPDDIKKSTRSDSRIPKSESTMISGPVSFHHLHFADRRKMLDAVARHVRLKIPQLFVEPLFPRAKSKITGETDIATVQEKMQKEVLQLAERRSLLIRMYSCGDPHSRRPVTWKHYNGVNSNYLMDKLCIPVEYSSGVLNIKSHNDCETYRSALAASSSSLDNMDGIQSQASRKQRLGKLIREKMKFIIGMGKNDEVGKPIDEDGNSGQRRVLLLQQFTMQGDTVALRLHAMHWDLKTYRTWPLMSDNRFALYKMPEQLPLKGREHAGLWGGTFGWPPGKPADDKPGKALYFLLLSYDCTQHGRILIATKILEGTHYVLHPNGSPMFTVNVDEPSSQNFPWRTDRDGAPVDILEVYQGEGIANGYGFRYPSSKPGDLYIMSTEMLAFVWRESQNVLTLQRLNLQALLEKGDRVSALAPIANYAYLIKSLSNVFVGFCGVANKSRTETRAM